MLGLFSVVVFNIVAAYAATENPQTSLPIDSSNLYLSFDNGPFGADLPDPRFKIETSFQPELLPPKPTLMGILSFMAELAYGDINAKIPAKTWKTPGFPEVEIVTTEIINANYLLFGIFAGIEYMIKYIRFNAVMITLRWEDAIVGRLWIGTSNDSVSQGFSNFTGTNVPAPEYESLPPAADDSIDPSSNLTSVASIPDTASLTSRSAFKINTIPPGRRLHRNDVFLLCYGTLLHLARYPNYAQLTDYVSRLPYNNVNINLLPWGPGVRNFRVIQMLAYIPRAMLKSPRGFREAKTSVIENDVLVLEASIQRVGQGGLGDDDYAAENKR